MAFAQLEPFGEDRADLRAGIIAATIANVNRGKGTRPFKPGDFMPDFERKSTMTPATIRSTLAAFVRAHNNAGKRRRGPSL